MSRLYDKLKEGDVIYTNCIGNGLCYHLGIVYKTKKHLLVFHNAPTNANKWGGTVIYETLPNFLKDRELFKITSTFAKNADILRVSKMCKYEVWDTFFFNCEDYVAEIVDGERRSDLRDAWKLGALGVTLLSVI